jgi:hypothetical protein
MNRGVEGADVLTSSFLSSRNVSNPKLWSSCEDGGSEKGMGGRTQSP